MNTTSIHQPYFGVMLAGKRVSSDYHLKKFVNLIKGKTHDKIDQ